MPISLQPRATLGPTTDVGLVVGGRCGGVLWINAHFFVAKAIVSLARPNVEPGVAGAGVTGGRQGR